jgi:Leucine-rich repeat (LRR) protein
VPHADNYIHYLDGYISGSTALESLNACQNELVAVPAEYSNLTNLKTLALANNKLKGLPVEIFGLASLITLDISSNQVVKVVMS